MPDFIRRFGEQREDGSWYLSADRQSLITSLLSAGYVFDASHVWKLHSQDTVSPVLLCAYSTFRGLDRIPDL